MLTSCNWAPSLISLSYGTPFCPPSADFQTQGKLPAEEAALYECVRLSVADVAAYVADGEFDWQRPAGGAGGGQLIPLLERTGMDIALQVRAGSCLLVSSQLPPGGVGQLPLSVAAGLLALGRS